MEDVLDLLKIVYQRIKPQDCYTILLRWKAMRMERMLLRREDRYKVNNIPRNKKIIVSLTSYPARFESLHLVIRSMLLQTMAPDEIILYLDNDDVVEKVPESLEGLKEYGLKIEWRPGRIKPHKKYYYAIQEHPNDIIITVDDDCLYPDDLIECLYKTHLQFPDCVVARRARKISFGKDKKIKSYNQWYLIGVKKGKPSLSLVATGVGGVLYPPHCMHQDMFEQELFLKLAPQTDDLWLKIMQIKVGTKVVTCGWKSVHKRALIPGTQEQALSYDNVLNNKNDECVRKLMRYYQLIAEDFGC